MIGTDNPSEEPRRNKNSTPLDRSYSSLSKVKSDVVKLGVVKRADTGKSH
jgi:hypothetical protein